MSHNRCVMFVVSLLQHLLLSMRVLDWQQKKKKDSQEKLSKEQEIGALVKGFI